MPEGNKFEAVWFETYIAHDLDDNEILLRFEETESAENFQSWWDEEGSQQFQAWLDKKGDRDVPEPRTTPARE
jgi:hypothetical protein